jgi:hypothetical protein
MTNRRQVIPHFFFGIVDSKLLMEIYICIYHRLYSQILWFTSGSRIKGLTMSSSLAEKNLNKDKN